MGHNMPLLLFFVGCFYARARFGFLSARFCGGFPNRECKHVVRQSVHPAYARLPFDLNGRKNPRPPSQLSLCLPCEFLALFIPLKIVVGGVGRIN